MLGFLSTKQSSPAKRGDWRFLVIDTNQSDIDTLKPLLIEAFPDATVASAASLDEAAERAAQTRYDFIISDLIPTPNSDPLDVLSRLHEMAPLVPVLICSDKDDTHLGLRAIQQGAQDYMVKNTASATTLRRIIQHSLERQRILDELEKTKNSLEQKVFERTRELATAMAMLNDASRAKEEFFANMTHELRTPLHAIINFSRFGAQKADTAKPEKLEEYFSNIHVSGKRLLKLVNDLLDLTKLTSGKADTQLELLSISPLLEDVNREMSSLLAQKSINLILPNSADDKRVWMDQMRIHQVLVNLIGNACKFSPEGKDIRVTVDYTTPDEHAQTSLAKQAAQPGLVVSVIDQGEGIPEDELHSVFDEFAQSNKVKSGSFSGGTGLGLAICRQIIAAHHGTIWAEHNPEGGAILRFMLPIDEVSQS